MEEIGTSGETLVNEGATPPPCSRHICTNHRLDKCVSQKHANRTILHNVREIDKVDYNINSEISTEIATKSVDLYCNAEAEGLIFVQSDIKSLMDQPSTASKIGIPSHGYF